MAMSSLMVAAAAWKARHIRGHDKYDKNKTFPKQAVWVLVFSCWNQHASLFSSELFYPPTSTLQPREAADAGVGKSKWRCSHDSCSLNDVNMGFWSGETCCEVINEVQAGFSDCSGKATTAYLAGCWKAADSSLLDWQCVKRFFLSDVQVQRVRRCVEPFEWLANTTRSAFLFTPFTACQVIYYWTRRRWDKTALSMLIKW